MHSSSISSSTFDVFKNSLRVHQGTPQARLQALFTHSSRFLDEFFQDSVKVFMHSSSISLSTLGISKKSFKSSSSILHICFKHSSGTPDVFKNLSSILQDFLNNSSGIHWQIFLHSSSNSSSTLDVFKSYSQVLRAFLKHFSLPSASILHAFLKYIFKLVWRLQEFLRVSHACLEAFFKHLSRFL